MNPTIQKISPVIWEKIKTSSSILINLHLSPDQDSIGSSLGLKSILENMGKKVTIVSSDPIGKETSETARLMKGFDQIVFKDPSEVDMVQYDLFIILDSDATSRISRNSEFKIPLKIPTIVIDHHQSNPEFGDLNLVIKDGFCTSELLYWLCKQENVDIPKESALDFFIGMVFDTGQFRYPGPTSSDSYRAAADLIDIGEIDFPKLIWNSLSKKNSLIKAMGIAISRVEEYFGAKVLLTSLLESDVVSCGMGPESMNTLYRVLSDFMSDSKEASITALIYQLSKEKWGISLRSNNSDDYKDVSLVAKKIPGGGGHMRAAGLSLDGELGEVKNKVINLIGETFPDLGQP